MQLTSVTRVIHSVYTLPHSPQIISVDIFPWSGHGNQAEPRHSTNTPPAAQLPSVLSPPWSLNEHRDTNGLYNFLLLIKYGDQAVAIMGPWKGGGKGVCPGFLKWGNEVRVYSWGVVMKIWSSFRVFMRPWKNILNYCNIQWQNNELLTHCDKKGSMVDSPLPYTLQDQISYLQTFFGGNYYQKNKTNFTLHKQT